MQFIPVKTCKLLPPRENIFPILEKYLPKLKEGDVIFITSKILALHQGRCIKIAKNINKDKLIIAEADRFVARNKVPRQLAVLTIKDYTLIPSSGIDESNGNGWYILWPKNTNQLLKQITKFLKKKYELKKLAVIATDSHTTPLRRGVTGVATGFYGLEPVTDLRGKKDIFGRRLKFTRVNVVDALAAMAVLLMGESAEKTPMLIIRDADFVKFTNKNSYRKLIIPPKEDLYYPLLKSFQKKK